MEMTGDWAVKPSDHPFVSFRRYPYWYYASHAEFAYFKVQIIF